MLKLVGTALYTYLVFFFCMSGGSLLLLLWSPVGGLISLLSRLFSIQWLVLCLLMAPAIYAHFAVADPAGRVTAAPVMAPKWIYSRLPAADKVHYILLRDFMRKPSTGRPRAAARMGLFAALCAATGALFVPAYAAAHGSSSPMGLQLRFGLLLGLLHTARYFGRGAQVLQFPHVGRGRYFRVKQRRERRIPAGMGPVSAPAAANRPSLCAAGCP